MRRYPRIFLLLCCMLWTGLAAAQLEVIPLKSRTADEVLPVLLPLVEPGGTLTGMNNQLFLRSSPANQAEIKRALAAIDRPARRLVIHVALDRRQVQADRGAAVSGQVTLGNRSGGERTRRSLGIRAARGVRTARNGYRWWMADRRSFRSGAVCHCLCDKR